jgi:hypothetical protein
MSTSVPVSPSLARQRPFVGSSNTLGEFRAGVNAASFGAVASALIGGVGSLLIAAIWMLIFPDLRRIDRFEPADKQKAEA